MEIKCDAKDMAIVEALKKDAKLSEKKLAKATGIPMTTVHNRIKKLVAGGIISQYTIKVDYGKLGKPIVAFVMFKITNQADHHKVFEQVKKVPGIYEAALITGEFDILFKARVSGMDELNQLVVHKLRQQKNIGESRTFICYQHYEAT